MWIYWVSGNAQGASTCIICPFISQHNCEETEAQRAEANNCRLSSKWVVQPRSITCAHVWTQWEGFPHPSSLPHSILELQLPQGNRATQKVAEIQERATPLAERSAWADLVWTLWLRATRGHCGHRKRPKCLVSSPKWLWSQGEGSLKSHWNRTQWKQHNLEKATKAARVFFYHRLHTPVESALHSKAEWLSWPWTAALH